MTGAKRPFAIGFVLALLIGITLAGMRPHFVERWALYLGSKREPASAHLFLDPFPNDASCETRVRVFAANTEPAFCTSHYEFEIGGANDTTLAAEFSPLSPASWFCLPRWAWPGSAAQKPTRVSQR